MRYVSTRGRCPDIGFRDAVVSGLAPDGGLFMPAFWPQIPAAEQAGFGGMSFAEVAANVLAHFAAPQLSAHDLLPMAEKAFAAFDTREVAPLRHLENDDYLLELFHGPTLAFKDIAMRMLAELFGWALEGSARGKTIIGATSGDTGGAAVHAFAGSAKAEVFMLHPKGRISHVQRRMMTTIDADNIVNIAVEGNFDDCQRLVKSLFADETMKKSLDPGGVNSINWVRLAVQTVYYFTATAALGEPAAFVVPTGNFGDAFAGHAAKRMGLPGNRLAIAVNTNDIMKRVLANGVYEPAPTKSTSSPSMDIGVASNFERLLFEACRKDAGALSRLMDDFERDRRMTLPANMKNAIAADFRAERADEGEVDAKIRSLHSKSGRIVDPHTAVGLVALDKLRRSGDIDGPAICLATAHPAKFPDTVVAACGVHPELPERYNNLMAGVERLIDAPADIGAIRAIIENRSLFLRGAHP